MSGGFPVLLYQRCSSQFGLDHFLPGLPICPDFPRNDPRGSGFPLVSSDYGDLWPYKPPVPGYDLSHDGPTTLPRLKMRRRLLRLALLSVLVPLALEAMDSAADRLETANGPTPVTKRMRQASRVGRALAQRR